MTVIDFMAAKRERDPHSTGLAVCLDCKHEWTAIVPAGTIWLECPACSLVRGRFKYNHEREGDHWHCYCGNYLFAVTEEGTYCPNCGTWKYPD